MKSDCRGEGGKLVRKTFYGSTHPTNTHTHAHAHCTPGVYRGQRAKYTLYICFRVNMSTLNISWHCFYGCFVTVFRDIDFFMMWFCAGTLNFFCHSFFFVTHVIQFADACGSILAHSSLILGGGGHTRNPPSRNGHHPFFGVQKFTISVRNQICFNIFPFFVFRGLYNKCRTRESKKKKNTSLKYLNWTLVIHVSWSTSSQLK